MTKKCGRCKNDYDGKSALSREDNETDICSQCGTEEALIDYYGSEKAVKIAFDKMVSTETD